MGCGSPVGSGSIGVPIGVPIGGPHIIGSGDIIIGSGDFMGAGRIIGGRQVVKSSFRRGAPFPIAGKDQVGNIGPVAGGESLTNLTISNGEMRALDTDDPNAYSLPLEINPDDGRIGWFMNNVFTELPIAESRRQLKLYLVKNGLTNQKSAQQFLAQYWPSDFPQFSSGATRIAKKKSTGGTGGTSNGSKGTSVTKKTGKSSSTGSTGHSAIAKAKGARGSFGTRGSVGKGLFHVGSKKIASRGIGNKDTRPTGPVKQCKDNESAPVLPTGITSLDPKVWTFVSKTKDGKYQYLNDRNKKIYTADEQIEVAKKTIAKLSGEVGPPRSLASHAKDLQDFIAAVQKRVETKTEDNNGSGERGYVADIPMSAVSDSVVWTQVESRADGSSIYRLNITGQRFRVPAQTEDSDFDGTAWIGTQSFWPSAGSIE